MNEIEWLQSRSGNGDDVLRSADSFLEKAKESESFSLASETVNVFDPDELDTDSLDGFAASLREEFFNYYVSPFLPENGYHTNQDIAQALKKKSVEVYAQDVRGLVSTILHAIHGEEHDFYPIRALYLQWQELELGVLVMSIEAKEPWLLSIAVAPYDEFFDPHDGHEYYLPIFERIWEGIPGDGSLTKSLVMALSGDLDGLAEIGFIDRVAPMSE